MIAQGGPAVSIQAVDRLIHLRVPGVRRRRADGDQDQPERVAAGGQGQAVVEGGGGAGLGVDLEDPRAGDARPERLGVVRVEGEALDVDLGRQPVPGLAAVGRAEDPSRAPGVEDDLVGIAGDRRRVDGERRDVRGAEVAARGPGPRPAVLGGAQNAHARVGGEDRVVGELHLAGTGVDRDVAVRRVRIGEVDRERADGERALVAHQRAPGRAAVAGDPDPGVGSAGVDGLAAGRMGGQGAHPAVDVARPQGGPLAGGPAGRRRAGARHPPLLPQRAFQGAWRDRVAPGGGRFREPAEQILLRLPVVERQRQVGAAARRHGDPRLPRPMPARCRLHLVDARWHGEHVAGDPAGGLRAEAPPRFGDRGEHEGTRHRERPPRFVGEVERDLGFWLRGGGEVEQEDGGEGDDVRCAHTGPPGRGEGEERNLERFRRRDRRARYARTKKCRRPRKGRRLWRLSRTIRRPAQCGMLV